MLNYGRIREDIIETYKILSGKYDTDVVPSVMGTNFLF